MMIGWKNYVVTEFLVPIEISNTVEISTNTGISVFQREIGDNIHFNDYKNFDDHRNFNDHRSFDGRTK